MKDLNKTDLAKSLSSFALEMDTRISSLKTSLTSTQLSASEAETLQLWVDHWSAERAAALHALASLSAASVSAFVPPTRRADDYTAEYLDAWMKDFT